MANEQSNGQSALRKIGARLRCLRLEHGLTLRELGARIDLTDACINQWEKGRSFPRPQNLERLAEALSTSVAYLVAGNAGAIDPNTDRDGAKSARCGSDAADIISRARRDIAHALGLPVSEVRVEFGKPAAAGSRQSRLAGSNKSRLEAAPERIPEHS